jgi:hypothetical protein
MAQEKARGRRHEAARTSPALGDMLLALFERIESVALECSWADLAREACDD